MKQPFAALTLPSPLGWGTGILWTSLLLAALGASCQRIPDEVEIEERRVASVVPPGDLNMSSRERFGRLTEEERAERLRMQQEQQPSAADMFNYELPEGWTVQPRTEMRLINLRPADDPNAACAVTVIGGEGGGLVNNVNRWRGQFGFAPASDEEILSLPLIKLLAGNATLVELEGDFAGMAGEGGKDWAMLGAIAQTPSAVIFVKMTAPKALMEQERDHFFAFVASLTLDGLGGVEDDHAGHNHAPGEGHEEDVVEEPQPEALPEDVTFSANGFQFTVPSTWSDGGSASMRTLNFRISSETECYLVVLPGQAGGLVPNINRWQGQMGLDPLSEEEVEALPRALFLGEEAYLLQADGDYVGMDGVPHTDMTMLAMLLMREDDSLFLKMTGPETEVVAQREAFLKLASTLEEVQ
jgi:hypothetical protein